MVKKYLTLWSFGLCLIMAGTANAAEHKEQTQKQIERYVVQQREMMGDFYQRKIARLKKMADKKIKRMEQSQREKLLKMTQIERQRRIDNWGFVLPGDLLTSKQKDDAKKQTGNKKQEILDKLDRSIVNIEKQKAHTLRNIAFREKQLKNSLSTKPEETHGVVTGIIYSKDNPMIILDRQIVKEGAIRNGAKIIKIHPNKVEFEGDGGRWTQKVREKRN